MKTLIRKHFVSLPQNQQNRNQLIHLNKLPPQIVHIVVIILCFAFNICTQQLLGQNLPESKYKPAANSPFGKEFSSQTYDNSDAFLKYYKIGIPAFSFLKNEIAIQGSYFYNDNEIAVMLGVPYKLNKFDATGFWDENIYSEFYSESFNRVSLKTTRNLLTNKVKGIVAGTAFRFYSFTDNKGGTALEFSYNLLYQKAAFDPSTLKDGSNTNYSALNQRFNIGYTHTYLIWNEKTANLYIEPAIGIGVGHITSTACANSENYKYQILQEKVKMWYPFIHLQFTVGCLIMHR